MYTCVHTLARLLVTHHMYTCTHPYNTWVTGYRNTATKDSWALRSLTLSLDKSQIELPMYTESNECWVHWYCEVVNMWACSFHFTVATTPHPASRLQVVKL